MLDEEDEPSLLELKKDLKDVGNEINQFEIKTMLSGEHDS